MEKEMLTEKHYDVIMSLVREVKQSQQDHLDKLESLHEKSIESFTHLLNESEKRIDKTNKVVMELADSAKELVKFSKELKDVYVDHLNRACLSRDKAASRCDQAVKMLDEANKRCDKLLDKLFDLAKQKNSDVIINSK